MTRSLQLPFKRTDASAAVDGALVWDPATARVQVSSLGAWQPTGAASAHSHVIADTAGLQAALDGKAATVHTHAIADTTGLQAALDGKQPLDADLTSIAALATTTYGRSLLTQADAAAARTTLAAAAATHTHAIADVTSLQTTLDAKPDLTSIRATGVLGYTAGAGGTVTQATSKSTSVTLNKAAGTVTMHNAALAAGAAVSFALNNSTIGPEDGVTLAPNGFLSYRVETQNVTSTGGGVTIRLTNVSGGSLSEAVKINFQVIKGART